MPNWMEIVLDSEGEVDVDPADPPAQIRSHHRWSAVGSLPAEWIHRRLARGASHLVCERCGLHAVAHYRRPFGHPSWVFATNERWTKSDGVDPNEGGTPDKWVEYDVSDPELRRYRTASRGHNHRVWVVAQRLAVVRFVLDE